MATRGRPQIITDDELLEAARAVFLEQAVGATTAAIARKARVAESVIFHRYKTKEALFLAVLDREARVPPILSGLEARLGKGRLEDTLFDVGMGIVEHIRVLMPFFMVASMMARAASWKLDKLEERMRNPPPAFERAAELLARYLDAEAEGGRLRKADAEAVARVYLAALHQHVMEAYWWSGQEISPHASPDFVRSLVDIFLLGLVPRSAAARQNHRA
jgi:AcrR family transcriptional regulator